MEPSTPGAFAASVPIELMLAICVPAERIRIESLPEVELQAELAARLALAGWSAIVEGGDEDAGALLAALGAVASFTAVIRGDVSQMTAALPPEFHGRLPAALERWRPRASFERAVQVCHAAQTLGIYLATPLDAVWPDGLQSLGLHAPVALWVRGRVDALLACRRSVSIVGSRATTNYGTHVAVELAGGLAQRGIAIVSGGALGIDIASHRAALSFRGTTISVMAGGVDHLYPRSNEATLLEITRTGAVISELPCGQPPYRNRFLSRNRIIAALSAATVVVEAAQRSGALNTVHHAAQLGRPVGAVPGPITSASSMGCHRVIRDVGAQVITSIDDVVRLDASLCNSSGGAHALMLEGLETMAEVQADAAQETQNGRPEPAFVGPVAAKLWDALPLRRGMGIDELAQKSGLSVADVRGAIGMLTLAGYAERSSSGWRRSGVAARNAASV